jgi:hypothetical protein
MRARRVFGAIWDFVVGDDPRLALAAVLAIGLTAVVCALGPSVWWLAPLIALAALRWSLRGAEPSATSAAAPPSTDGKVVPNARVPQASVRAADQPDVQSPPE